MILKEQAALIMQKLNGIANDLFVETEDDMYDVQFYITDNFQIYNQVTKLDDKEYIPAILNRIDPFIPKSSDGVVVDYLELRFYAKFKHKEALERITERYKDIYHSVPSFSGTELYTQYVGKFVYEDEERAQTGMTENGKPVRFFYGTLRIEWDTVLDGIPYDQTEIKIDGIVYPVKIQTYRNDKATVSTKEYKRNWTKDPETEEITHELDTTNTNANLVSESLILTIPLNAQTITSALWQDIHSRTYNKIYTIDDKYSGVTITKDWELKSGIVNKEENKIVSFTAIFDIPLPRATMDITYKPLNELPVEGTVIVTNFTNTSSNTLDGRMLDRFVKGKEVRQVNGYSLSFLYEPGNEMAKILAERSHKKVDGDRFDITYTFEDLTFTMTDLVIEKGSHAFNDNPGIIFTITFAEGV